MALLHPDPYPVPQWHSGIDSQEFFEEEDRVWQALVRQSQEARGLVGTLLKWQRADGYAIYIVTCDYPLTIQHVPLGDAYTVEPALIRGLNEDDVIEQKRYSAAWRKLQNARD